MFKVYFGSYEDRKLLKEFDDFDMAEKYIFKFINDEFNNISYYINIWGFDENGWRTYDFGSHTIFFYIKDTRRGN